MKRKILITGATGFIGRNLLNFFIKQQEDYEVFATFRNICPDIDGVSFLKADLTKPEDVYRVIEGKDIVIQAAAVTSGSKDIIEQPYLHVTDNAIMNVLILEAVHHNNIKQFIFFSCTVMYQSSNQAISELDIDLNQSVYGKYYGVAWTKLYIEKMCEFYSKISETKYTILRHSNIYGPYDKFDLEKSHVLGATINKVINSKGNEIVVWGDGKSGRDFLYVSDLIDCVNNLINNQKENYLLVNVGSGVLTTVKDLVMSIIKISERDIKIKYDLSKPSINTNIFLDISKIKNKFNWEPKYNLNSGLIKTINWFLLNDKNVKRSSRQY